MGRSFTRAKRSGVGVFVALAGGSRSGKSFSGLRLARGLAGEKGRIAALDTEAGRLSHYSDRFDFDVSDMKAPFTPSLFAEAAEDAEREGYDALLIDSFSLEWNGVGGVLDWQERELDRMAGDDWKKRERVKMAAWIKPKMAHKAMRDRLLQCRIPIVFCLRAEEKFEMRDGKPTSIGWKPVQDKTFIYEWTVGLTLHHETPGRIRYDMDHKIAGDHQPFFQNGELIGEAAGEALRAWAHGEEAAVHQAVESKHRDSADRLIAKIESAMTPSELLAITDDPAVRKWRDNRRADDPATSRRVDEIVRDHMVNLQAAAAAPAEEAAA